MTQEAENSKKSVLEAFLKQRAKRQSNSVIEARRLVNLYRHLSLFGPDFLEEYNKMLLQASPEVQSALSDIIGGAIVRQYFDFLKGRSKQTDGMDLSDDEAANAYQYRHEESYLPSADDVMPFYYGGIGKTVSASGSNESSHDFAVRSGGFEQALERQSEFLLHALEKVQHNIAQTTNDNCSTAAVINELVALQQGQKETLTELLQKQNEQTAANINAVLKQTQEMSVRQMEMVEKVVDNLTHRTVDPYAVIEEDSDQLPYETVAAPVAPDYINNAVFETPEVQLEPMAENTVSEKTVVDMQSSDMIEKNGN